jgi:DNA-binding IclR family transcriptional regulator
MSKAERILTKVTKPSIRRRVPRSGMVTNGEESVGNPYYLRSIGRALKVLNCFDGRSPLSLTEIRARVPLPEASLFRVLQTLEKEEYLHQFHDGTYQLAPRMIFGWLFGAADRMREIARPELERLVSIFNETVSLAYLFDDRIHVLDCTETYHEIRMTNKIGRTLAPHCSSLGKAITAFQERNLAERLVEVYGLAPRTENTITDRHELFAEFENVRKSCIACDREESTRGGICFAAPIRPALSQSCPQSVCRRRLFAWTASANRRFRTHYWAPHKPSHLGYDVGSMGNQRRRHLSGFHSCSFPSQNGCHGARSFAERLNINPVRRHSRKLPVAVRIPPERGCKPEGRTLAFLSA